MDAEVEAFYRQVFAEGGVNQEEAHVMAEYFENLNPPPDKLVWLRATAFRIGTQYLGDDKEKNISILRTINVICHELEHACMEPAKLEHTEKFDEDKVPLFYAGVYKNHLTIDRNENELIIKFFRDENPPPIKDLTMVRATAFKVGCDFLTDDNDSNVSLFKCINVVVHAFESVCFQPKPYKLKASIPVDKTIAVIGLHDSINHAVQQMWNLDVNRLTPDVDYEMSIQGGKKPYWKEDDAPFPLFTRVDKDAACRPTYSSLIALLEHYSDEHSVVSKKIVTDPANCKEVWSFLCAIMQTAPMQFCHKYCHANNPHKVPADHQGFIQLLHKIWFERYPRSHGGRKDSSGFEHVFVGEIKDDQVSGFHNWVRFYLEEKRGKVDYRGYIKPKSRTDALADSNDHVLTLQFFWKGVEKIMGTSFIGVSPEFEMAVYSTCFLVGKEENPIELDTGTDLFGLIIKCYTMGRDKIGSSYPEATLHHEE